MVRTNHKFKVERTQSPQRGAQSNFLQNYRIPRLSQRQNQEPNYHHVDPQNVHESRSRSRLRENHARRPRRES
ncbi:hypothetical protein PVAND_017755, partial [Polypedilum vanderplanki]